MSFVGFQNKVHGNYADAITNKIQKLQIYNIAVFLIYKTNYSPLPSSYNLLFCLQFIISSCNKI